jgi:heme/copper-type cytochrome/quinol oxidase subunit 3
VTTGFHGLHVTMGTIFLVFCFVRHIWTSSGATGLLKTFVKEMIIRFSSAEKYEHLMTQIGTLRDV